MNHKNINNNELSPFSIPCNCFHLRRAARAASRQYGKFMKSTGLKATQFSVLAVISEKPGLSITDLAEILGLERTSLSRTLTPLVKDQLVSVSEEGARRVKTVLITKSGLKLLAKAMPLWEEAQAEFEAKMGADEVQSLLHLLQKVSAERPESLQVYSRPMTVSA